MREGHLADKDNFEWIETERVVPFDTYVFSDDVYSFFHPLYSPDMIHQMQLDIPRMTCIVNQQQVFSYKAWVQAISYVQPAWVPLLSPFASQACMGSPYHVLCARFPGSHVLDGGEPMRLSVECTPCTFSLRLTKAMSIHEETTLQTVHTMEMVIFYESSSAELVTYWFEPLTTTRLFS